MLFQTEEVLNEGCDRRLVINPIHADAHYWVVVIQDAQGVSIALQNAEGYPIDSIAAHNDDLEPYA